MAGIRHLRQRVDHGDRDQFLFHRPIEHPADPPGPGMNLEFLAADQNIVKKLVGMAIPNIDVYEIGGDPGLLRICGNSGFNLTIERPTLTITPVS